MINNTNTAKLQQPVAEDFMAIAGNVEAPYGIKVGKTTEQEIINNFNGNKHR